MAASFRHILRLQFKDGLSLKITSSYINLSYINTNYVLNNALKKVKPKTSKHLVNI